MILPELDTVSSVAKNAFQQAFLEGALGCSHFPESRELMTWSRSQIIITVRVAVPSAFQLVARIAQSILHSAFSVPVVTMNQLKEAEKKATLIVQEARKGKEFFL